MTEYVTVTATITDKWGHTQTVEAGTQPAWAWQIDKCAAWRKAKRAQLVNDRTSDPRGWRVTFTAAPLD